MQPILILISILPIVIAFKFRQSSVAFRKQMYRSSSRQWGIRNHDNGQNERNPIVNEIVESTSRTQTYHSWTVCIVPTEREPWETITQARTLFNDPGLFRWPPHVNLLYPFIALQPNIVGEHNISNNNISNNTLIEDDILHRLGTAASQCEPFIVTLDQLGCFGGATRGVLWLYPTSHQDETPTPTPTPTQTHADKVQPLIQLQTRLMQQFPECHNKKKYGTFQPHMTISHFPNLEEANQAKTQIKEWWPRNVTFRVRDIFLLERKGDNDQFLRIATIPLGGSSSCSIHQHTPPEAFPMMPTYEEGWIRQERMKMKERRRKNHEFNKATGKRNTRLRSNANGSGGRSRSQDTPEQIQAKRAARAAKRETLKQSDEAEHPSSCEINLMQYKNNPSESQNLADFLLQCDCLRTRSYVNVFVPKDTSK